MLKHIKITIKLRAAFLISVLTVIGVDLYYDHDFHVSHMLGIVVALVMAEISNREIMNTVRRAKYLLKTVWGTEDFLEEEGDELFQLRKMMARTIEQYSPRESVERVLERNRDVADAVSGAFSLRGRVHSGKSVLGETWSRPAEELLGETDASRKDLSYRSKLRLWKRCVETAGVELENIERHLLNRGKKELAGIIRFQNLVLTDPSLQKQVKRTLASNDSFSVLIRNCFDAIRANLENPNPALDRSADLLDLEQRILAIAARSSSNEPTPQLNLTGKIVLSQSLLPSECLHFVHQGAAGFITLREQVASHVHILLSSLNVPSVSSFEDVADLDLPNGTRVLVDGNHGVVHIRPSPEVIESCSDLLSPVPLEPEEKDKEPLYYGGEKACVLANVNVLDEIDLVLSSNPDGVGLFRSELCFIDRKEPPGLEEQVTAYRRVLDAFEPGKVALRLFDIGGDKFGFMGERSKESNPCLGNRSIRLLLREKDCLRTQLSAMILAMEEKGGTIIVPMISRMEEVEDYLEFYLDTLAGLGESDRGARKIKLGLMVEVPSIVEMMDVVVKRFDSFHIGSNDLTQYTLAADRNNEEVEHIYSPPSPAVFRMLKRVISIATEANKDVSLCGELASHLNMVPILAGLGLRRFSVSHASLRPLRRCIRELNPLACEDLADRVMQVSTAAEIYKLLNDYERQLRPSEPHAAATKSR